jgi:hypothetical protein
MMIRKKILYAVVLGLTNVVGFGLLATEYNDIFIIPAIIAFILASGYIMSRRCLNCGKYLYQRKTTIDGIETTYWGGELIPRTCPHCGVELK